VDTQCDKLATDDRRQFITLSVHLKTRPHQQQCRINIVEATGNNVEATFDFVEATIDFVERRKFQRETRSTLLPYLATKSNVASTLLLVWTGFKLTTLATVDVQLQIVLQVQSLGQSFRGN